MIFDLNCEFQAQTNHSIAKIRLVDFTQINLQNWIKYLSQTIIVTWMSVFRQCEYPNSLF